MYMYDLILVHVHVGLDISTCTLPLDVSTCTIPLDVSTCTLPFDIII